MSVFPPLWVRLWWWWSESQYGNDVVVMKKKKKKQTLEMDLGEKQSSSENQWLRFGRIVFPQNGINNGNNQSKVGKRVGIEVFLLLMKMEIKSF